MYDQEDLPIAGCQLAPPSMETSTAATVPPPQSTAVPDTVRGLPIGTPVPGSGDSIVVMGGIVSVDFRRRNQSSLQRRRLDVHVGQHIQGGLLDPRVDRDVEDRPVGVVVVETPRPLHGTRAPHQCSAGAAIHRHVVRQRPEVRTSLRSPA